MKSKWTVIAAFVGIFIAGAVTGTFLGVRVIHYFSPRPIGADQYWSQEMEKFTVELDLTPDQSAKIAPIVQQTAEDLRKARREAFKTATVIFDNMYASIARELTDAQRVRLNEMETRERAHHAQWMTGHSKPHGDMPPPHDGPPPQPSGPGVNPNNVQASAP